MKKIIGVIAAVICALLTSCAALSGLSHKPEVTLIGLNLVQLGVFEQRFALKLRIQNPNDVELRITGLAFDVEVNEQPFVKGLSDKAVTVPRFGEAVLEVMASGTLAKALNQLRELQKGGRERIDYRVVGRLSVSGIGSVPFERSGDLPLSAPGPTPKRPLPKGSERT